MLDRLTLDDGTVLRYEKHQHWAEFPDGTRTKKSLTLAGMHHELMKRRKKNVASVHGKGE